MATSRRAAGAASTPARKASRSAGARPSAPRAAPHQLAFVLHQWDWSETSLVLDLFTRETGRVAAVAKGAKRPYSQLRPVLMPFQRLQVGLGKGAGEGGSEVLNLRTADYLGGGGLLPPAKLMAGFYLNELLLKLLARGDPHSALFDAYADTLTALSQDEDEAPLRAFELVLLRLIGLLPELDRDTATQAPLQAGRAYRLHPEAGLVGASSAGTTGPDAGLSTTLGAPLGADYCQALERALAAGSQGATLAPLRTACRTDLPALRSQLRPLLHYHLGSPVLRTRQLMLDVRRLLETARAAGPAAPSPPGPP